MTKVDAEIWCFPQTPTHNSTTDYLFDLIVTFIEDGTLKPGERLPAYRAIAELNLLPRTSIYRVYKRLEDKGWVDPVKGSGTFVSVNFPNHEHFYPETRTVKWLPISLSKLTVAKNIDEVHFQDFVTIGLHTPGPHYLSSWLHFIKTKKYTAVYANFNQMKMIQAINGGAYKAAILEYLNSKRNFLINENGLEIILGRKESLQQIFNILLKPGDVVVNTSPKDKQLCQILNGYSGVESQFINMDMEFLQELKNLLSHTHIKALHLRPQSSYPNSYALESNVCTELLSLAKQHGFYIVEEDDYHECWYKTKPFKPLVCLNHNGHVIYCGAFSLISSYLQQTRTIIAAEEFIALLQQNPVAINPFKNIVMEAVVIDLMNNNKLWQTIKKMQQEMKDNLFASRMQMENALGKVVKINEPSSGLTLWLTFPDARTLMESIAYLEKNGFQLPCFPDTQKSGPGVKHVRLGFGTWDDLEVQEPLKALFAKFSTLS